MHLHALQIPKCCWHLSSFLHPYRFLKWLCFFKILTWVNTCLPLPSFLKLNFLFCCCYLQNRSRCNLLKFCLFLMEDSFFTILRWFLPHINVNQPQVHICPLLLATFLIEVLFSFLVDPFPCLSSLRIVVLTYARNVSRRRQWHPTPVILPGKSHGWSSLVGCSPWGC